jgi:pimeloyl-ACP methyl ester carboxylesterase
MMEVLSTRELITLDGHGYPVRCTYHKTGDRTSDAPLGLLFLNSFSTPRAWYGDTAVRWADQLAASGYPCFRIDLPGLGDSAGETPDGLLDFINDGGHGSIVAAKVKEITARFQLSGLVIVGHCAGAVTAVFAAAERKECKGLVLMDPYFHLTKGLQPKIRLKVGNLASRNKIVARLTKIYAFVRETRRKWNKNAPPGNANFGMLSRCRQLASAGTPVLILKAQAPGTTGANLKPGQFDYFKYVLGLGGRESRVRLQFVEDSDHCFADQTGRRAVRQVVVQWLGAMFPQSQPIHSAALAACTVTELEDADAMELKNRCLPA